jgi:hypothetical protein
MFKITVLNYGETDCLLSRLQIHLRQLRNGTHLSYRLLEAFQEQKNEIGFQFFVFVSGFFKML